MEMYNLNIPAIANRLKYCVTDEAKAEFFKIELQNAFDHGWQEGFGQGLLQGEIDGIDKQIEGMKSEINNIPKL